MKIKNVLLSVILIMVFLCSGCTKGSEGKTPVNVAFVLGVLDGETKISSKINELTELSDCPNSTYTFISPEGSPRVIDQGVIANLSSRGYTSKMMQRIQEGIRAELTDKINSYTPSLSECDMAGAITLAVRSLNAHEVSGRQNILVIKASGRSTAKLINMLETPVYKMDVEASAQTIAAQMNDISMKDVDKVVFYSLGDYDLSQPQLNNAEKTKLQEFYTKLFINLDMNEENIEFKDISLTEYYSFPKKISSIEVEGISSGLKELADDTFADPILISEEKVSYIPDTSNFVDPEAAQKALIPVVEYLKQNRQKEILLYSTCAGDTDSEYSQKLAAERTKKLSSLLLKEGVEEKQITAIKIDNKNDPYYQWGLKTGPGSEINRKSVMTDIESELAKQLLTNTDINVIEISKEDQE